MTTSTLTSGNLSDDFVITNDGDIQVIISNASVFAGAIFRIEYEADGAVFIPIEESRTTEAYSRIYTFKAGTIRLALIGNPDTGDSTTNIVVDVKA